MYEWDNDQAGDPKAKMIKVVTQVERTDRFSINQLEQEIVRNQQSITDIQARNQELQTKISEAKDELDIA